MIDNGMKLVQQIDALTYNSRQVLNALIRSCVQSGSSNGYTVKRGETTLVLDRNSIYKLYDFYQRWEREDFAEDVFDSLLSDCDAMWGAGGNEVTKAVATHSQICFLKTSEVGISTEDMGTASADSLKQWCEKVKTVNNKKGTVNSAPIPLNLRTPLYDENLSTKSFSQYETYLFPMEYHVANILGTIGDGDDHYAGGENWIIETDDTIKLYGKHVLIGDTPFGESVPSVKKINYGDSHFTLGAGKNTYAFGDYAAAFNENTIAYGQDSVALGRHSIAYGLASVAGGSYGYASGENSVEYGDHAIAVGPNSFAAGAYVNAGDKVYEFSLSTRSNTYTTSECTVVTDENGACVKQEKKSTESIYGLTVKCGVLNFNISVGDTVKIFAQIRQKDAQEYYPTDENNGYVYTEMLATVTKTTYDSRADGYFVELDREIPITENGIGIIVGGYITRYSYTVNDINIWTGELRSDTRTLVAGRNSVALNSYTVAAGENQTVVGAGNYANIDARFIVGTGEAKAGGEVCNGLVVSPYYSAMRMPSGYVALTVSDGVGVNLNKTYRGVGGDICNGVAMQGCRYDSGSDFYYKDRSIVNAYRGGAMLWHEQSEIGEEMEGVSRIAVGGFGRGIAMIEPDLDVTAAVESYSGTVVVSSGPASYITATGETSSFMKYMVTRDGGLLSKQYTGDKANGNVGIYGQNNIEIAASNEAGTSTIMLSTCGYLIAEFDYLRLIGDTYGTLAATGDSRSHVKSIYEINEANNGNYPNFSGFYYSDKLVCRDEGTRAGVYWDKGHVIASSIVSGVDTAGNDVYNTAGLVIPDVERDANGEIYDQARPAIWMHDPKGGNRIKALAYYSDVVGETTQLNTRVNSLEQYPLAPAGMALVGFKPDAYREDFDTSGVIFRGERTYIASNRQAYDASENGLSVPVVIYLNGGSKIYRRYALECLTGSFTDEIGWPCSMKNIDTNHKLISDVWSSMNGNYLNLHFTYSFPSAGINAIEFSLFLGGGTYSYIETLLKWHGLQNFTWTDSSNGVDFTFKYGWYVPGMLRVTMTNRNALNVPSGSVDIFGMMTPLKMTYNDGSNAKREYIVSGKKAPDALITSELYGGLYYSDTTT